MDNDIKEQLERIETKLDKIDTALYDPDNGLYARVTKNKHDLSKFIAIIIASGGLAGAGAAQLLKLF